jgi:hypothetical protein
LIVTIYIRYCLELNTYEFPFVICRWKIYRNICSFDKNVICDRFSAMNPTLLQYDEELVFYERQITDIDEMDKYYDIYCIR